MALNFNKFAVEANTFLKAYTKKLNLKDTEKAGRILSSIEESLNLIAQFPMFLKAVYVNGWTTHKKEKIKSMSEFIDLVRKYDGVTSVYDFESDDVAENYIFTTFIQLRKYISLGELEDIRTELPKELKSMVYHNVMF